MAANQALYQSDTLIDGHAYSWPKFEITNVTHNGNYLFYNLTFTCIYWFTLLNFFVGQSYNLHSTCPLDSVLFPLYPINHMDINIVEEFSTAPSHSSHAVLAETFRIVDSEGWDQARIHWLLHFNIINPTRRRTVNLFGMLKESTLQFLCEQQRYSSSAICSREDCLNHRETFTSTEIDLL